MQRILFLEDDPVLADTVIDLLEDEGFGVEHVKEGEAALDRSYENDYDLYLFDVNVPGVNGFELLKALRDADDGTPAFFITALVDIASIGSGFASGADDYIKKPFDPDELIIRIRAKLAQSVQAIAYKGFSYDPGSRQLTHEGSPVDLGEIQKEIFHLLMTHLGQTVDKSHFFDVMEQPSDQALRVHITKLKQRTGLDISNVRGVGYRLEKS